MGSNNRVFTILMADDDPDDRLFAKKAFNELGISESLLMAENGEELLSYLDQCITISEQQQFTIPDLILLDLNMPEKSGWVILEEIKKVRTLQDIPIVIWTGSDNDEDRLRSIEMGADYFITKPGNYSDLLSGIRSLIKLFCGNYQNRKVEVSVTTDKKGKNKKAPGNRE